MGLGPSNFAQRTIDFVVVEEPGLLVVRPQVHRPIPADLERLARRIVALIQAGALYAARPTLTVVDERR